VAHPFASHLGLDDLNPALLADDTPVLHAFLLTAVAFIVFDRAEYLGTKESVSFGFEGSVIDRLRFLDFTEGSLPDLFRRRNGYLHRIVTGWVFGLCKEIV
jgi:hypothetical protein